MGFWSKALAILLLAGILSLVGGLSIFLLILGIWVLVEIGYGIYLIFADRYDDWDDGRR